MFAYRHYFKINKPDWFGVVYLIQWSTWQRVKVTYLTEISDLVWPLVRIHKLLFIGLYFLFLFFNYGFIIIMHAVLPCIFLKVRRYICIITDNDPCGSRSMYKETELYLQNIFNFFIEIFINGAQIIKFVKIFPLALYML